jgi:DNA-binding cell septation regulator SpoVG
MQTCTKMLGGVLTETAHFELFVPNLKKWVELEETLAVKGALLDKESISPYSYYILLMNEWLDVEDPEFAPILKFLTVRLEAEVQKPDHLGVSHSWCFLGLISSQIFKNTDDDLVFADDDLVFEYLQLLLVSYEAIKKVDRKQIIITTTAQILLIIRSYMFMCIFKEPSQRIKETWMKIFQIIYLTGYKIPDFTILIGLRKTAHYIYKGFAQLDKHNNLTFCQKRKVKKSKGTVGDINMKEYDDVTMDYQRAIKEWKLAIGEYEERNVYKYSGILTTLKELILYYSKMVSPPIAPEYKEKITNDILEFYEFSNYEQSKNRVEHLLDL